MAKICPNCGKLLTIDDYETTFDYEYGDTTCYIVCDGCGYDERDDYEYTPSATMGDYSPSCPWNAPGMSISDFI